MKTVVLNKFRETIYYEKLSNGLDVYLWPRKTVNNIYATLSVKFGSVDTHFKVNNKEYTLPNGIAHFLEHVKFNEGPNKTAHEYYQKLGSSINAFTTFNYTSYEVFASSNIKENITHLLDYVETPYFTKELIRKEKDIIKNEVKMGLNTPSQVLYYAVNNGLYKNYKEKYLITGTVSDVDSISLEDVTLAYNTFYHPSNMFLTITGNFNVDEVMMIIKENQDNKEFREYCNPIKMRDREPSKVFNTYQEITGNITIPKTVISYKIRKNTFGISDRELLLYTKMLMNANYGSTSDIKEYLLTNNLITKLGVSSSIVDEYLIIMLSFESNYPKEVTKKLEDTFNKLSITKKRLTRRIRCNIADYIYGFDDIEFMNMYIQDSIINYNKIIDNEYDILKSLRVSIANNVIKVLKNNVPAVVTMIPKEN